jgi:hypothetical protein
MNHFCSKSKSKSEKYRIFLAITGPDGRKAADGSFPFQAAENKKKI